MSSLPLATSIGVRHQQDGARQFAFEMAVRCGLAALAVIVCYTFEWEWLRGLTAAGNLWLDGLAGVHLQRLSYDTVAWHGQVYRYVIACTFADVWCGSLAFLWLAEQSVRRNLAVVALWSAALFAFNIFRLSVSDVLFAWGLSWNLAHNVVSGIAYFVVWQALWSRLKARPMLKEEQISRAPVENL
jgi:hypothetical protein